MKNQKSKILKNRSKKIVKPLKKPILLEKQASLIKQQKTSTYYILLQPNILKYVPFYTNLREHKQQVNFLQKCFSKIFYQYQFNDQEKKSLIQYLQKISHFPSITLQNLFYTQQEPFLSNKFENKHLYEYLKILNYESSNKNKKFLLSKNNHTLKLVQSYSRDFYHSSFQGRFISELQRQIVQNRLNFMEKIKISQQKYSDSKCQLTQTAQQLLYLARIYKDNTSKIKKLSSQLQCKIQNLQQVPKNSPQKLYYEVVMKKNILYAFKQHQIDVFNYFRDKQNEQRNMFETQKRLESPQDFKNYIRTKRGKKGKSAKYGLPTACASCFSDYYESINPLVTCQSCDLRCHVYCLNLKQKQCGNCVYKRMLKIQKQRVQFCFICKQKGLMNYKLDNDRYCHYFCMFIHNFWRVSEYKQKGLQKDQILQKKVMIRIDQDFGKQIQQNIKIKTENTNQLLNQNQCQKQENNPNFYFNQIKYQLSFSQDYVHKSFQSYSIDDEKNIHAIHDKNLTNQYRQKEKFKQFGQLMQIQGNYSFLNFDVQKRQRIIDSNFHQSSFHCNEKNKKLFSNFQNPQKILQNHNNCSICLQKTYQNLYFSCQNCKKNYHGFCSFFQGHRFTMQTKDNDDIMSEKCEKVQKMELNVDCCGISNIEKQNLKRKREFILNKNRFLYQNL